MVKMSEDRRSMDGGTLVGKNGDPVFREFEKEKTSDRNVMHSEVRLLV